MKRPFSVLLVFFIAGSAWAGPFAPDAPASNYVVVGAFADPQNAGLFTRNLQTQWPAECRFNASRNLYYVYVLKTGSRAEALEQARQLRENSPYRDTWVYQGWLDEPGPGAGPAAAALPAAPATAPVENELPANVLAPQPEAPRVRADARPAGTRPVFFRIYQQDSDKPLEGEVAVIDAETGKRKGQYKGNVLVQVPAVNQSGSVSVVCEVVGYRKVGHIFNIHEPAADEGMREEGGVLHVPFGLTRLRKGDIQVLHHVFFFKDAAIMRPESRGEVNALRDMLAENPAMNIRIHGHTNGNASGKIIQPGSSDFFSLNQSKETFGSAKKLSASRAAVIKSFLVSEGIDARRLEVSAWGGKRPLYDKMHSQAQLNVRVEIEVTAH